MYGEAEGREKAQLEQTNDDWSSCAVLYGSPGRAALGGALAARTGLDLWWKSDLECHVEIRWSIMLRLVSC